MLGTGRQVGIRNKATVGGQDSKISLGGAAQGTAATTRTRRPTDTCRNKVVVYDSMMYAYGQKL